MTPALPYTAHADGVRLAVRLTPRAARSGLDGLVAGADRRIAVQLRVAAPPVEGAANAALIGYLAEVLELRRSEIRIVSGETARRKVVALVGDPVVLSGRIGEWIAAAPLRR